MKKTKQNNLLQWRERIDTQVYWNRYSSLTIYRIVIQRWLELKKESESKGRRYSHLLDLFLNRLKIIHNIHNKCYRIHQRNGHKKKNNILLSRKKACIAILLSIHTQKH